MRYDSKAGGMHEQPVIDCGGGQISMTKYCHGVATFMLYGSGWFM
jgi:hypothetical protein